jgi:hypothetical protein
LGHPICWERAKDKLDDLGDKIDGMKDKVGGDEDEARRGEAGDGRPVQPAGGLAVANGASGWRPVLVGAAFVPNVHIQVARPASYLNEGRDVETGVVPIPPSSIQVD